MTKARIWAARALVLLLVPASLAACADGSTDEPASASAPMSNGDRRVAGDSVATGTDGPDLPDDQNGGPKAHKKGSARDGSSAGGSDPSRQPRSDHDKASDGPSSSQGEVERAGPDVGPKEQQRRPGGRDRDATASMPDPAGDSQGEGEVPSYMDLTNARLSREGGLRIALEFANTLPARMPDNRSHMVAGIDLRVGKKEISIYAEGREDGWRPRTSETDASSFPGTMSRAGNTLVLEVSDSFMGRADSFTWYGHSSWTRSTVTDTDYAFDQAPDINRAEFPN